MSNLVEHAKRELEFAGNDKDFNDSIIKAVEAFTSYGHSGGSASVAIPMLNDLLQFRNLTPLTDDPDEWQQHNKEMWDGETSVWQSKRNSEAFSDDKGKTYYLLSDRDRYINESELPIYESQKKLDASDGGEMKVASVSDIASPDTPTTTNEKGGRQSHIPVRFDLIDGKALFEMAKVLHAGAEKYGEDNWRLISVKEHLNHLLMHAFAYLAGDESDEHLSHIMCRATFAQGVALQTEEV